MIATPIECIDWEAKQGLLRLGAYLVALAPLGGSGIVA